MTSNQTPALTPFERLAFAWSRAVSFVVFSMAFVIISVGIVTLPANLVALIAAWHRLGERGSVGEIVAAYRAAFRSAFTPSLIIAWPIAVVLAFTLIDVQAGKVIPGPLRLSDLIGLLVLDYVVVGLSTICLIELSDEMTARSAWLKTLTQIRTHRRGTAAYMLILGACIVLAKIWPLFAFLGMGGTIIVSGNHFVLHRTKVKSANNHYEG